MSLESIKSMTTVLQRAKLALAVRVDPEGSDLRHEVDNCLTILSLAMSVPPVRAEAIDLLQHAAAVYARVKQYARRHSLYLVREGEASSGDIEAVHAAIVGPNARTTLVECPACVDCQLCLGERLVTPAMAAAWRQQNRRSPRM